MKSNPIFIPSSSIPCPSSSLRLKSISKALKYTDKFSKGRRYSKLYLDYKNMTEEHCVSEPEFKRRIRNGLKPKFAILNKIRLRRLREQNIL